MAAPTTEFRTQLIAKLYPDPGTDGYIVPEYSKSLKTFIRGAEDDTAAVKSLHVRTLEDETTQSPNWEHGFDIGQSPALIIGPHGTPATWQTHALHAIAFQLDIEGHIRTDSITTVEEYQWLIMKTVIEAQQTIRSNVSQVQYMTFLSAAIESYRAGGKGERWHVIPITVVGQLSVQLRP
jgi:hypothetical protein